MRNLIYLFLTVLIVACSDDTKKPNESWLLVHTADNAQLTNSVTIVMPITNDIFAFTDRPYRKHLYMDGKQYTSLWDDNDDTNNFYADPPNAVLTWVDEDKIKELEVVITGAIFDGNTISYTIINNSGIITGDIVYVSLFIDDINDLGPDGSCFLCWPPPGMPNG
mgnify:CR=1 FL=1|tara:strand:- start:197 stop:691 length:495 start_codon:yes stop_codon:yes gene_type:complete